MRVGTNEGTSSPRAPRSGTDDVVAAGDLRPGTGAALVTHPRDHE